MSLRTRLFVTFVTVTIVCLAAAGYAILQLSALRDIAFEQRERHATAFLTVGRFQTTLATFDRLARSYVATPDGDFRDGIRGALDEAAAQLRRLTAAGYADAAPGLETEFFTLRRDVNGIEALVEADSLQAATARLDVLERRLDALGAGLEHVAREIDRRSREDLDRARAISASVASTALGLGLVALAAALAIGAWSTYRITAPLQRLRHAMTSVAGGSLQPEMSLPFERRDEIGDLARSFRSMTRQLTEANRLKAEFVGMATHDLRTPVSVIAGFTHLMEDELLGEVTDRQREALECILEQTRTLTRLSAQLLDTARLDAGGLTVDPGDVSTAAFFTSLGRGFEAIAALAQVDFSVDVDSDIPPTFRADGDRLRDQVLSNLLNNAFKFTPRGERVRIRVWRDDDTLRIDVADTGPGIPAELLPRIFDRFSQAKSARARGSGLGLAIAKEVVEAHGGRIDVESGPDRGTCFRIRLPGAVPAAVPKTTTRPGERPGPRVPHR